MPEESAAATAERKDGLDRGGIGGHPKGLTTLFFTEMWERFSYYGMRSLLILFMTDSVRGGMGFDVARAGRIYGLYTAAVYFAALPGGWIADHFLGLRRAVLLGGIVIALGQFSLAIHNTAAFYTGLFLIVLGTGLLKPNISAMVGELYAEGDSRRDAGFSIYYMGINLGAFFSPLVCGTLGEMLGWRWGFLMGGVGMVFGLLQYVLTGSRLGSAGLLRKKPEASTDAGGSKTSLGNLLWLGGFGVIVLALVMPQFSALQRFFLLALGSSLFISSLYMGGSFTPAERKRGVVIYLLFWIAALFWSTFEQAGSSLNLFAERMTRTTLFGFDFPVTWFQSLNPLYIITLAPVFSWLWMRLGKYEPSGPAKFTYGLLLVGIGFLPMAFAAQLARGGENPVSPMWLVTTYFIHTLGELCLSPVGLSLMTKLSPSRIVGQIMGVWFLAAAIGNYIGGEIASLFEAFPLPRLFGTVAVVNIAIALMFALAVPRVRKLMGGVH
jgi:POT family proton-dependent oligopeptide transporter